jgi:2C-methyl-D-erythritol 2,4-cyclodiphosphate synthase
VALDAIGINATSGEDLTAFGQGQGVQAFCIVSLVKAA